MAEVLALTSYHQKRYGAWAGYPQGSAPVPGRCAKEVWHGFHASQCTRKRGHGPEGAFCKQHAKKVRTDA